MPEIDIEKNIEKFFEEACCYDCIQLVLPLLMIPFVCSRPTDTP